MIAGRTQENHFLSTRLLQTSAVVVGEYHYCKPCALLNIVRARNSTRFAEMAFGIGRGLATPLLVINFLLYLIAACLAGWALNRIIDHGTGAVGRPAFSTFSWSLWLWLVLVWTQIIRIRVPFPMHDAVDLATAQCSTAWKAFSCWTYLKCPICCQGERLTNLNLWCRQCSDSGLPHCGTRRLHGRFGFRIRRHPSRARLERCQPCCSRCDLLNRLAPCSPCHGVRTVILAIRLLFVSLIRLEVRLSWSGPSCHR